MNEFCIPLHLIGFPSPSLAVAAINSTVKVQKLNSLWLYTVQVAKFRNLTGRTYEFIHSFMGWDMHPSFI